MLRGVFGGALQPVRITVGAAVVDVIRHLPDKFPQSVILLHPDLHADGGGVFQQAVPPGLVFLPGVNVGVVPECHRLNALFPQGIDAAQRAGSAAAVQQNSFHSPRLVFFEWVKYTIKLPEGNPGKNGNLNIFFTFFRNIADCTSDWKRVSYQLMWYLVGSGQKLPGNRFPKGGKSFESRSRRGVHYHQMCGSG